MADTKSTMVGSALVGALVGAGLVAGLVSKPEPKPVVLEDVSAAASCDGGCSGVPAVPAKHVHDWHLSSIRHSLPNHQDVYCCICSERRCVKPAEIKVDCAAKHGPYWDKRECE